MRSLLVADRAFSEGKSSVLTEEDAELTFLCLCVGGNDAGVGTCGWERSGTGLGCECNSPQPPLRLGAPKGRTEAIKPKNPTQTSKPSKIHSKRICGCFSTTGVKTQTGWSFPLSTQLSIFHMELQLQLCCWRAPLGWKAAGEFSQKFLLIWTNLWAVSLGSRTIFCAAQEHHWSESTQGRRSLTPEQEGNQGLQWAAFPGEQGLTPHLPAHSSPLLVKAMAERRLQRG